MKEIFPEFSQTSDGYFKTTLRLLGDEGYYFTTVVSFGLSDFLKDIYLAMNFHKCDLRIIPNLGYAINTLDDNMLTEKERLINLYLPHMKYDTI